MRLWRAGAVQLWAACSWPAARASLQPTAAACARLLPAARGAGRETLPFLALLLPFCKRLMPLLALLPCMLSKTQPFLTVLLPVCQSLHVAAIA